MVSPRRWESDVILAIIKTAFADIINQTVFHFSRRADQYPGIACLEDDQKAVEDCISSYAFQLSRRNKMINGIPGHQRKYDINSTGQDHDKGDGDQMFSIRFCITQELSPQPQVKSFGVFLLFRITHKLNLPYF